jgi:hypothetical protein
MDVAGWTATQGNRSSISSDVVTTDQMGGSIKKAQVGHVIIISGEKSTTKRNEIGNNCDYQSQELDKTELSLKIVNLTTS